MHIRPLRPLRPVSCGWVALLVAAAFAVPDAAHGHIEVETSSPDRNDVLYASPPHIRILFSGRIEARYTSLTLTAPDGSDVQIGDVVFIGDSDREITTLLPALEQTGSYTVRWRTAGADGHVLEGSFVFVLATDSARGAAARSSDTTADAGTGQPAAVADHAEHDEPRSVGGAADAIGRGLHFIALLLLLGAVSFRALLMPRLALTDVTSAVLQRRTWRMAAAAALLLGAAAVVRLWFQSAALHGAERAWNTQLLSIMLTDTGWGRAWMLQAFLFALLGMAIVWARPRRERAALFAAVPAVLGLSAIPGLSGHAAAANGVLSLAVVNDAVHVAAAGAWLGTLAMVMLVALPAIVKLESNGESAAADAVDRFSPIALTGGAVVLLSGIVNAFMHLSTPGQLWTTGYGRVLTVKVLLVALVAVAGIVNWRKVRPQLRHAGSARRLRLSAGMELTFALFVLIATAVLTGQPRP